LAMSGLMLAWSFCGTSDAQPKEIALPKGCPREVTGVGVDLENAKAKALSEAVEVVKTLMSLQEPPLRSFKIDEQYVREHVVDEGRAGKELKNDALEKPVQVWVRHFRTDNPWWSSIVRQDRAKERQSLAALVVGGLSLLLFAGFSYLRLDEYT